MTTTTQPSDLVPIVLDVVRRCVDQPDVEIGEDTELLDLPSFDSLTIVEVVEGLEQATGAEIAPDKLVPETFASVRTIAETVSAAGAPRGDVRSEEGDPLD